MSDYRNDRIRRTTRGGTDGRRPVRPSVPPAPKPGPAAGGRVRPVWFLVVADLLALGIALNIFALSDNYFRPAASVEQLPTAGMASSRPAPQPTQSADASAQGSPSPAASLESSPASESQTPIPPADPDTGMWGVQFADKFTGGEVEKTDTAYRSHDISIAINKSQENGFEYIVADIYVRNKENFQSFFHNDRFGAGIKSTLDQAKARNAILAINGDNSGNRSNRLGYEVRNGDLYHTSPWQDVLVMYNDGSMKTFDRNGFEQEFDKIKQTGAWQVWTFGPMLLDANAQPMTKFAPESLTKSGNERTAIGYYEPGHYCFVVVGSTDKENRSGPSLADLSQKMSSLGCTAAYNMDGGQSSEMVFDGKFVNTPYHGGRSVSDIVGICEVN